MAEFVQQSIEEMIPELEQMERVGLFTNAETRQILKKRRSYEYKLRRRTKCKEDYLQYIQHKLYVCTNEFCKKFARSQTTNRGQLLMEYEVNLLHLVKNRRKRTGYTFKKVEIDIAIVQRTHKLFRLALVRFKDDIKLWLSYIEFAKSRREKATVSRLFTRMLQIHSKRPELWITAAKWEFEDNANHGNARGLLQRGLRFNPESKHLWLEYYRLELLFAEKMRKRKEILGKAPPGEDDDQEELLRGQVARVVFQKAVDNFQGDLNFLLSFIRICHLFDFTSDQEEEMYKVLQNLYPDKPQTWDALARRWLHRQIAETDGGLALDSETIFHQVFTEATQKLQSVVGSSASHQTDKFSYAIATEEIWSLYLKACLELLGKKAGMKVKDKRLHSTLSVFEEARKKKLLSADLFDSWIDVLIRVGLIEKAQKMVLEATTEYPNSVFLWQRRLTLLTTSHCTEEELTTVFKKALESLPPKETWPLWEIVIQNGMCADSQNITQLLEGASSSNCREVCLPAKEIYLDTVYLRQGIKAARALYQRLMQVKPLSLNFYKQCIQMESLQSKPRMKVLRRAYEEALDEYGKASPDLWLDYIQLEIQHPKGQPENVGSIHFRAMKALEGKLVQEFVTKYTLLQTEN